MEEQILGKLREKTAIIGVVGMGYVGLPLMLTYAKEGFNVIGFDIDQKKTEDINNGVSYIHHISSHEINDMVKKERVKATCSFSRIKDVDAIILCVPTPLGKHREPDLSYIRETMKSITPWLRKGQIISLESTTYPGTTDEELVATIEKQGLKVGKDVFVVYSPEREDPGNKEYTTKTIPKVIGGTTEACGRIGYTLYNAALEKVVKVSSTKSAEMTKLLENIHRAVNIGLVNELKPVCEKMGIDLYEVIKAAATKPFGFVAYYPGPGLGGHCIPIDPFYLTWKAREYGMHTRFIELAGEVNTSMPGYVVGKVIEGLNTNGKALKGSKVLILGISYKKNVDDVRESPSIEIMEILQDKGVEVDYSDPFFPHFPKMRNHKFEKESISIDKKKIVEYDAVVIATDHDTFDYKMIRESAQLIVDTRGRYDIRDNVIRS